VGAIDLIRISFIDDELHLHWFV